MTINKIDSNVTGLRYAEESSIKVLPGSPIFYPLEPNGYNDFGGKLKTVARDPINPSRQRLKGVITDLDAAGGWGQDLTQNNLTRLLQGFFFADIHQKRCTAPFNGTAEVITGVAAATDTYTASAATGLADFKTGDLVLASGFDQSANNGLKLVVSSTATTVVVGDGLVDEAAPSAAAKLQKVGIEMGDSELDMDVSGSYPRLKRASGTVDFTTLGLVPGGWLFVGGDGADEAFTTAANNGFARIRAVAAAYIELDKTSGTAVAETGTGLTVRVFYGNDLKNENDPANIKRRTYQIERTLGNDDNGVMSEYLTGAVPNEVDLTVKQADKVTMDLSMMAVDYEQRDGTTGVKAGTRPDLLSEAAFNTSSDFSRIKLHTIQDGVTNPTPLFAFMTDLALTVKNNLTANKAIAVLGAFDVTAGTFEVSGTITAYFASVAAVQAVRNNSDVALDFALVKNNAGLVWDIPLIALGDGQLKIEKDNPVTLSLTTDAAKGSQGHTLLMTEFPYLPDAADL